MAGRRVQIRNRLGEVLCEVGLRAARRSGCEVREKKPAEKKKERTELPRWRPPDPFARVAAKQRRRLVLMAVATLTRRQAQVIDLVYAQDLTFFEVGMALEITESAAWQAHDRALVALRAWFERRGIRSMEGI